MPENTITVSIKRGFSPEEQYRVKGEQGPWTDLYSLCGTMYFMLTEKIPEESVERVYADHLVMLQQMEDVSLPLPQKKAIDKGMAVLAKDRYQDLEEFYNELYPDKNRVSSYNDIHLPKSFRDTLTQTENSGLFSRTAVRREFGEIAGKKGRKRRKVKWIVVTSILITAIAGILWIQYSGKMEKDAPVSSENEPAATMPAEASPVPTVTNLPVTAEPYVEIPNVIGKTSAKAKDKLQKMGIRIKVEKTDNRKKKGTVLQQSIAAGTQVKKESLITLTVSRGEKKAVQTSAPTQASVVTSHPKATKKPQKYDASLDGYLQ